MIELSNDKIKVGIKLPTTVDEITAEMLEQLTTQVKLGKNYVLIALCYEVTFADLVFDNKKQKPTRVYTKVAKANLDTDYIDVHVGDVVAISQSAIEMGQHIYIKSVASEASVKAFLLEKARLTRANATSIVPSDIKDIDAKSFLLIEFKVVPVHDIKAYFDYSTNCVDPFKLK